MKIPTIVCLGLSDTNCAFGPAIRDQYIIHFVFSGKGYFNGKPVEAGQGFIMTPGTAHEYHYDKNDPWAYLWFKSYDDTIIPFLEMLGAVDGIFTYKNRDELLSVIDQIKPQKSKITSVTHTVEIFLHIFNTCISKKKSNTLSTSKYYCDYCKRYIDLNLDMPVSVGSLCELLGITQPYLYKVFLSELGVSPKRYIIQRKIQKAKSMLAETDLSISVIASSLGFSDTISFSKFFKSSVGISPSAFRSNK